MNHKKWKIPVIIASAATIVSLIFLLVWVYYIVPYYVVPSTRGDHFVSFSSEFHYIAGPGASMMEIVYVNGSVVPVVHIELKINVTNSYLAPVQVSYNGFEFVWLIYNQTMTDPADVVGNKDFLIWGAFYTSYSIQGWGMYGFDYWSEGLGNMTGYEYYVTHKDQTNFTKTIPVGTHRHYVFYEVHWFPTSFWYGQNLHGQPVSPGTYYNYFMAYGKISKPINLTVTSVLWPHMHASKEQK